MTAQPASDQVAAPLSGLTSTKATRDGLPRRLGLSTDDFLGRERDSAGCAAAYAFGAKPAKLALDR